MIIAETNPQVKLRNNRKKLRFRSKLANSMTLDLDNTKKKYTKKKYI